MAIKLLLLLSIIIVNYNVKFFTEQCLYSVQKAIAGMDAEVIVVDNNSIDESVAYLEEKFTWVNFIANKENTGYARANNQGWQIAKGDMVLFLNPDTILGEDCLSMAAAVLRQDAQLGALGMRMIDGSGHFLPESKRGFPSPATSFFKLTGVIKIFPRSATFSRYYMGRLPEKENNEIEVLSGACMMIKKEVLEKTAGFDEQFFMYGEDIDLSYRIRQAGYKNYYLGEKAIIHFKGESTRKDIRYTKMFYKAMAIFVQKHYGKKTKLFNLTVQTGIILRGGLSFFGRLLLGSKPGMTKSTLLRSIVAGAPAEAKKAASILMSQEQPRKIVYTEDITVMANVIQKEKAAEIVFCAGAVSYSAIIHFMEQADDNIVYWFFAAGSDSIVGSESKNSSGKTMILQKR